MVRYCSRGEVRNGGGRRGSAGKEYSMSDSEFGLKLVYEKHGKLTPDFVLQEAADPSHPLHKLFEWDNQRAAHEHRLHQAYQLIRASKFVVTLHEQKDRPPQKVVVREYIAERRGEGFHPRPIVLSEVTRRKAFIEQKRNELKGWCNSVADVSEFVSLRTAIQSLLEDMLVEDDAAE